MDNSSILLISDMHHPYAHPDLLEFLKHLKNKYKPTRVICLGDEIDYHAISFHEHNPDLLSPGDELKTAQNRLKPLFEMFPQMDILESNHGSLVYRKGITNGLPRHVFKSYREILGAPRGWKWHFDLTIKLPTGQHLYLHHSKGAKPLQVSQAMGMCYIGGHHHEKFSIEYWANSLGLYWACQAGCLIDKDTIAFEYGKNNLKRPLIGTAVVLDGLPKLEPMILHKNGRWIGKLI